MHLVEWVRVSRLVCVMQDKHTDIILEAPLPKHSNRVIVSLIGILT